MRFGELSVKQNQRLLKGVVRGIGGYGNCIGIPTTAGEIEFDERYDGNPLVNAMCVLSITIWYKKVLLKVKEIQSFM